MGKLAALLQLEYTQGRDSLQNKEEKQTPQSSVQGTVSQPAPSLTPREPTYSSQRSS